MTNAEQQLETTRDLQREFWEALSNLEEILGVEIDGTADLSLATIATLMKGEPLEDDDEEELLDAAVEDVRGTFAGIGIELEEEPFTPRGPRQSDPDAMVDWVGENLTPPEETK